jgi:hypothetical protein
MIWVIFFQMERQYSMVERVEMTRRNVVVDGKVYSVKRESEPVFLLRLSDLSVRYLVVIADPIDFHGFQRLVWPINAEQISVFERLDDATAYFLKLTTPPAAV